MAELGSGENLAPLRPDDWIDVGRTGDRVYATVNLKGGSVSSRWHVRSLREVEDIAARYGIPRREVHVEPGAFADA